MRGVTRDKYSIKLYETSGLATVAEALRSGDRTVRKLVVSGEYAK